MQMDKASQALAQRLLASVPRSFRAIADHTAIPRSTLHAHQICERSADASGSVQSGESYYPAQECLVL